MWKWLYASRFAHAQEGGGGGEATDGPPWASPEQQIISPDSLASLPLVDIVVLMVKQLPFLGKTDLC